MQESSTISEGAGPRTAIEFLFGWWVRWQACKMAATVLSNRQHPDDRALAPICWSLAVFFESYMWYGSGDTQEEFGPKEPVELKQIV